MAAQEPQAPSTVQSAPVRAPNDPRVREPPRPAVDRLVTGVLVRHGPERFQFDPNGEPSYFITVRTDRGERTLWGRGIERALVESRSKPKPGDPVGVRENGIDPVTFVLRERDDRGHVKSETRRDTPRPHWVIEHREYFNARAAAAKALRDPRASRHEAIRNHPELLGAYWALDSAKKIAAQRISDRGSRERFVALVRDALAHATERGEPLPAAPANRNGTSKPVRGRDDEGLTR